MTPPQPVHPKGLRARVLLSSVFGPYGRDDAYGSRAVNPMELYQNQVTRVQGAFSLRMFHRSFGLMMLQANMAAPCTLLDFPTLERFTRELESTSYDIIGIGAILPNLEKVKKMCALIRRLQPGATIVVGGHIAGAAAALPLSIDADHIVTGEGIRWFRRFLGQDPDAPIQHPMVPSAFGARILGVPLSDHPGDTAAILIPSVGCPVGCNFCATSALFGGKGRFINFFETGDALFEVMCRMEKTMSVRSFFILDENFLLHRRRALRLLELMERGNKSWMLNVFSSARVLRSYTMAQIIGLGIGWVWMGIEGQGSGYRKLEDVDTRVLVKRLQSNGIRVLGSSIIGLEDHTPEAMAGVIDHAVAHATDFHQFMLYTPIPGTPLYETHRKAGTLLDAAEMPMADVHGQYRFNYRHAHIPRGREEAFLLEAFKRDFRENGPSLARLIRTLLTGWQAHKHHPEARVRERYRWEVKPLRTTYAGAVWAMCRYYRNDRAMHDRLQRLLSDIIAEFGWRTRLAALAIGPYVYARILREEKRLAAGWCYEPAVIYEKNPAAQALDAAARRHVAAPAPAVCHPVPAAVAGGE